MTLASDIASTIQTAVTDATTASTTARTAADSFTATDTSVTPAEAVAFADTAAAQVPIAQNAADLAFAQGLAAAQAAAQATAGRSQFEQALIKAAQESALAAAQEAADAVPVAFDDTVSTTEDVIGGVTTNLLTNDERADETALVDGSITSIGTPTHGDVTLVSQVDTITLLGWGPGRRCCNSYNQWRDFFSSGTGYTSSC